MNEPSQPLVAGGGRKYTVALVVLVILTLARACDWITGAQLLEGLKYVLALFGGANVLARGVDAIKAALTKPKEPAAS